MDIPNVTSCRILFGCRFTFLNLYTLDILLLGIICMDGYICVVEHESGHGFEIFLFLLLDSVVFGFSVCWTDFGPS